MCIIIYNISLCSVSIFRVETQSQIDFFEMLDKKISEVGSLECVNNSGLYLMIACCLCRVQIMFRISVRNDLQSVSSQQFIKNHIHLLL